MMFYRFVLLILSIITFAIPAHCFMIQGQVKRQTTKYGTVDVQCIFNNITVTPGSSFKLPAPDCFECKCTTKSMICAGYGYKAGVVAPPPGCVAHNDACKLVFVKENNPSELCEFGKTMNTLKKKLRAKLKN